MPSQVISLRSKTIRTALGCPANLPEMADLYCLDRLDARHAAEFETHFLCCVACLKEVQRTDEFILALGAASESLAAKPSAVGAITWPEVPCAEQRGPDTLVLACAQPE